MRSKGGLSSFKNPVVIGTALLLVVLLFMVTRWGNGGSLGGLRSSAGQNRKKVLVMVPGHGVFVNGQWDVQDWLQKFVPGIEEHISQAVQEFGADSSAVVMFSGGETHKEVGRISEGQSYIDAAKHMGLVTPQTILYPEDFARDSFENVLFSLCRFRQITGVYPEKYVVIGFEFKRERFVNEHRRAIRFPLDQFEYRGVPKPTQTIDEQAEMERKGTIPQFKADPYGCKSPLSSKKEGRNPFHQIHSYEAACPEMAGLFRACGPEIYSGPLPWD